MQLSRLRIGVAAAAVALATLAIAASPASASFHLEMVNEVGLQSSTGDSSAQFVELFDKGGIEETFPSIDAPYKLVIYDAAGNKLGEQTLNATGLHNASVAGTQYLISTHAADTAFGTHGDEVLNHALPLQAGQACYTVGSSETAFSCITWGCITHAISASSGTGSASGAVPPAGQSDQRQADNSIEIASPTPGKPNIAGAKTQACATQPGGGGAFQGVTVKGHKLKLNSHNRVSIALSCPTGSGGCSGRIKLELKSGGSLGSASFRLGDGKTTKVKLKLKAAKLKQFAGKHKIHAEAVVSAHDDAGHAKTTTAHVVLIHPKSG
jgi:hypothetical protein